MLKVYSHPDSYRIIVNLNILIYLGYRIRVKRPVWFRGKGKVFFTPKLFPLPKPAS